MSLWFDHWHPRGPLNLLFSELLIFSSRLSRQATVADLFSDYGQALKVSLESWEHPLPVLSLIPDRFCWLENSSGLFSVASAWETIRLKKDLVPWFAFIWSNAIIPRYQFNLWLMAKNRLPTQVRLLSYGRIESATCAFCNSRPDSLDHLFFGCRISASLAFFWAARCNLPWQNRSWSDNLQWAMKFLSGKEFHHCIARFSFGALCHMIWKKRNGILFREETLVVPALKNHLIKVVKNKALIFTNVADTTRHRRFQRNWGVDPSIFSPLVGTSPL
ncbi:uncharacterized protein LOC120294385 [Eucalyptus grandis]|uniref:uncharacterized protein LOC120294385 n=1 Tax=Eucalyptus grandis TaxID=71139 RepID=UPI00192EAE29|nr:uncharacterized protein LOC120294385 [Eucalyptus grandis]